MLKSKSATKRTIPHQDGERSLIPVLRAPVILLLAMLAIVPFLFTNVPPLTDVPGHIGQFTVETAAAGDGLWRYYSFQWGLTLNMASDLIVGVVHPILGVVPAMWLLCAATPALTVVGLVSLARATNSRGAYALPWSLLFVFNLPFLWGFLNFSFTLALSLIAFAAWIALDGRRRLRAASFAAVTPMLLVGHGVAGITAIAMIVGFTAWEHNLNQRGDSKLKAMKVIATVWPPVLAGIATLIVWKAVSSGDGGVTMWLPHRKTGAIVHMLQDQNKVFDIGSVACAVIVWILGWRWKARLADGPAGAVVTVIILFLAAPSLLSGSDEIDTRLAPLIPMLAFAMQDWSRVDVGRRQLVLVAGFALLALRFGVTTVSFAEYGRRYDRELAALDLIPQGSRVMNLTEVQCDGWRSERLEHLANLATTYRGAWVNSHWSVEGLHLLQVRYRPSREYYNDPSQMVFPARCVDPTVKPYAAYRASQTVVQAVRSLPLEKVDYLWIIGTRLPPTYRNARLRRIWNDDFSELYATRATQLAPKGGHPDGTSLLALHPGRVRSRYARNDATTGKETFEHA